jgi:Nif-specific regulatory protein
MPKLAVLSGERKGLTFHLPKQKVTIGRDFSSEFQLQGKRISRHHALLEPVGDGWQVTDLGSRNGTYVNDKPIKTVRLSPRDEIRIGEITLVFLVEEEEAASAARESTAQLNILEETLVGEGSEILQTQAPEEDLTQVRQVNEKLRALLELTRKVGAVPSLSELMEGVSAAVQACIEPDRVVPLVVNEDGSLMPWVITRSDFADELSALPISRSIVDHACKRRAAVLSVHAAKDERFRSAASIAINQIATALCVPIIFEEKVMGVLYVDRLGEAESFTHEDLETLNAIGLCLAAPLQNLSFRERLSHEKQILAREIRNQYNIIGQSQPIKTVYNFIEKAASSDACVLITGESGTGKELVARAVHYNSSRSDRPLEIVNCAALNHTLMDSELFGHAKGAFTDAREERPGRFELADGGTIFLDEMAELSEASQSKLLRVLETGELRRLGDTRDRHVNIRVVAATNRDIQEAIEKGKFRADLYYRLNVLHINLPPLRERPGDIEVLASHFLKEFSNKCAKPELQFSSEAREAILDYHWPGNVRQLKNVIERMVVMSSSQVLGLEDVPPEIRREPPPSGAGAAAGPLVPLAELERQHILRVLQHTGGNKKETASILGIDRSTLYARLKTYGIEA